MNLKNLISIFLLWQFNDNLVSKWLHVRLQISNILNKYTYFWIYINKNIKASTNPYSNVSLKSNITTNKQTSIGIFIISLFLSISPHHFPLPPLFFSWKSSWNVLNIVCLQGNFHDINLLAIWMGFWVRWTWIRSLSSYVILSTWLHSVNLSFF